MSYNKTYFQIMHAQAVIIFFLMFCRLVKGIFNICQCDLTSISLLGITRNAVYGKYIMSFKLK